jgi:hypothetical protein
VHSLLASWLPLALQQVTSGVPTAFSGFADALFALQRFCIECALGVVAAPVVIAGVSRALAREHAGKVAFCLYLVPTLMVALACRIDWPFSLHFLVLYHALCLFLWVTILGTARTRFVVIGMAIVAIEGLACVWFADVRLLPANGLNLSQVRASQLCWLLGYVALMLAILIGASWEVGKLHAKVDEASPAPALTLINVRLAGTKILIGLAITAGVIALYSVYCLRFYPR